MGTLFNATRIQLQLVYFVYYLPIVKELLRNYEDASHSGNADANKISYVLINILLIE